MKKLTKILFITAMVLTAFATISCNLFEQLKAPKNKWVEFELEYDQTTSAKVRCFAYYTEESRDVTIFDDENFTLEPGLTIFARPVLKNLANDDSLFGAAVEGEANKQFVVKTFKNGEKIQMNKDSEDNSSSDQGFKLGYSTWMVLYNSIKSISTQTGVPESIRDGKRMGDANFKWKKLMYLMAIDKLDKLAEME